MIYCDYAATTPMHQCAIDAWVDNAHLLNPGSQYALGRQARRVLEQSREKIAQLVDAEPIEVIFTGSGTESDNIALEGLYDPTRPVLASPIEHPAIKEKLESWNNVEYWDVDTHGRVIIDADKDSQAACATLMLANNETGAIQPVEQLCAWAEEKNIPVHVDAVQALGHIPVSFHDLGATTMAASAHKFGGPRGMGLLFAQRNPALKPLLYGGGQERKIRPGTVDVASAAATAAALEYSCAHMKEEAARIASLRDMLRQKILSSIDNVIIHTPEDNALPGHLYISFCGAEGDSLLMLFDAANIACSTGSACASGVNRASHVLLAQGISEADARSAIRFTLGHANTQEDIEHIAAVLPGIIATARRAGMA